MVDRSFVVDNQVERERIRSLATTLTDADLARPLADGWTVSAVLSHLAFTDRLWLEKFAEWERTGTVRLPEIALDQWDAMILAMRPWWLTREFPEARHEVVAAAEAVDRAIELLSESVLQQILELRPRTAIRALHRRAHLADIDRAVGNVP